MKDDCLSGSVLMRIHKPVSLNAEDILDDFTACGSRRMDWLAPSSSTFSNGKRKSLPF